MHAQIHASICFVRLVLHWLGRLDESLYVFFWAGFVHKVLQVQCSATVELEHILVPAVGDGRGSAISHPFSCQVRIISWGFAFSPHTAGEIIITDIY